MTEEAREYRVEIARLTAELSEAHMARQAAIEESAELRKQNELLRAELAEAEDCRRAAVARLEAVDGRVRRVSEKFQAFIRETEAYL